MPFLQQLTNGPNLNYCCLCKTPERNKPHLFSLKKHKLCCVVLCCVVLCCVVLCCVVLCCVVLCCVRVVFVLCSCCVVLCSCCVVLHRTNVACLTVNTTGRFPRRFPQRPPNKHIRDHNRVYNSTPIDRNISIGVFLRLFIPRCVAVYMER
jgi:hypothetical protein